MQNCDNTPMVMRRVSKHGEDLWGSTSLLVFQKSYIDCSPAKDAPIASIAFLVLIGTQLLKAPLPASTHHPSKRKWRRLYKEDQDMRRPQSDNKHLNGTTANRVDFIQHTATTDRDTRKTRFLRVNKVRYTEQGYEGKSLGRVKT